MTEMYEHTSRRLYVLRKNLNVAIFAKRSDQTYFYSILQSKFNRRRVTTPSQWPTPKRKKNIYIGEISSTRNKKWVKQFSEIKSLDIL